MKKRLPKLAISLSFGLLIFVSLLFVPANLALAADALKFNPQIPIPGMGSGPIDVGSESDGMMTSDLLSRYIKAIYDYGLKAAGVLAAVVLMGGGLIWLTSGGNQTKIGQAKEMIIGSVTGLIILFGAYMILNTVNPALLELKPISLITIKNNEKVCCEENGTAYMKGELDCTGIKYPGYLIDSSSGKCAKTGCCFKDGVSDSFKSMGQGYCIDVFESSCAANAIFKPEKVCSDLSECKKEGISQMDCKGVAEGDWCNNDGGIKATCYSGICYLNPSRLDEPCGNEGAYCMVSEKCTSQYAKRDWLGGNDCASGLKCCRIGGSW